MFMWHANSGDILLHILEACRENCMKRFGGWEQERYFWPRSGFQSKQKRLYLSRISLIPSLSLSLYPNLLCTEDSPPRSALGGTLGALKNIWGRQALMYVILFRVKGKTLITWPRLIIYTRLVFSLVECNSHRLSGPCCTCSILNLLLRNSQITVNVLNEFLTLG